MRHILFTLLMTATLTVPTLAQAPTASPTAASTPNPDPATTVNGIVITQGALAQRADTEAWLVSREIGGFAGAFYAQNTDADEMLATIRTVYGVQLAALDDPERYVTTVLNSMEVDAVLRDIAASEGIVVTDAEVDALIFEHITLAEGLDAPPDEIAVARFFLAASEATGVDETDIRALFEGRALRAIFYRAVTATREGDTPTQDDNATFQAWAFEQIQAADILRNPDFTAAIPADADYRARVDEAIADVLVAGLLPPSTP
ncbi:MAG: hypothetical protein AAF125_20990 [Chloroflexota bacterium]